MSRRRKAREPRPGYVIEGRRGVPHAYVMTGSTVLHTSTGLTRWHALGRAVKWAKRHGADTHLTVGRWSEGPPR